MKRLILLAAMLLTAVSLSGCPHPNDISDDVAQAAATAALG